MYRLGWLFIFFTFTFCKQNKIPSGVEADFSKKSVVLSPTAGWMPESEFILSQPSNILTVDGYSYVFYTKEPIGSPMAGTGYGGDIYYAFSRDQGRTWSEQGLLISKGLQDAFDAGGVSQPTVIKVTGEETFYYMYYVGVGKDFNNQDASDQNKTHIGIAKLIFNETNGGIRLALKLNGAKPVLSPSETGSGRFDAFRIEHPQAINSNGQQWIYYTGLDKIGGTARMGLAIATDINEVHVKQNNLRALLDGSPSLVQKQESGVLAIFPDTQIAWYAEDGIHFSKLRSKFPAAIKGAKGNADENKLTWGLTDPLTKGQGFGRWEIK